VPQTEKDQKKKRLSKKVIKEQKFFV